MSKIHWFEPPGLTNKACPHCASTDVKVILEAQDYSSADLFHPLARCTHCEVLFYVDLAPDSKSEHYDNEAIFPNATKLALELLTGTQLFIDVINRVPKERFESYLEVGCGVGTAVDYVQRELLKRAVGVEPSAYGQEGSRQLGIEIYNEYLDNVAEIANEKFGLLASFEVIEHTYDPADFIEKLKPWLRPDGIMILTTPNANIVQPKLPEAKVYPPLFPGEHKIILTERELERMLKAAGLRYVISTSTDSLLIFYASAQPFELVQNASELAYPDYLRNRISRFDAEQQNSYVMGAYLFRLVAALIIRGEYRSAEPFIAGLLRCIGLSKEILPSDIVLRARRASTSTLNGYGDQLPYFSGTAMYYLGRFYQVYKKDPETAHRFFSAASEVIQVEVELRPLAFLWPASLLAASRVYAGCTAMDKGAVQEGWSALRDLISDPGLEKKLRKKAIKRMKKGSWRILWHKVASALKPHRNGLSD